MEPDISFEKRFKVLCDISRAQHFAWREAALALAPDLDPQQLVNKMWEITGVQTAKAYLKRLDPDQPLAPQVAACIESSSVCMGENAAAEPGEGDDAYIRHVTCPWHDWHERLDLLSEDRPGCDAWFASTIAEINRALGANLKFETKCSLPEGGDCCLRRLWVERSSASQSGNEKE